MGTIAWIYCGTMCAGGFSFFLEAAVFVFLLVGCSLLLWGAITYLDIVWDSFCGRTSLFVGAALWFLFSRNLHHYCVRRTTWIQCTIISGVGRWSSVKPVETALFFWSIFFNFAGFCFSSSYFFFLVSVRRYFFLLRSWPICALSPKRCCAARLPTSSVGSRISSQLIFLSFVLPTAVAAADAVFFCAALKLRSTFSSTARRCPCDSASSARRRRLWRRCLKNTKRYISCGTTARPFQKKATQETQPVLSVNGFRFFWGVETYFVQY